MRTVRVYDNINYSQIIIKEFIEIINTCTKKWYTGSSAESTNSFNFVWYSINPFQEQFISATPSAGALITICCSIRARMIRVSLSFISSLSPYLSLSVFSLFSNQNHKVIQEWLCGVALLSAEQRGTRSVLRCTCTSINAKRLRARDELLVTHAIIVCDSDDRMCHVAKLYDRSLRVAIWKREARKTWIKSLRTRWDLHFFNLMSFK